MIMVFGIDIGTLSFFIFSFLVGVIATLQAIFGCSKETKQHRIVRGAIGIAYACITVAAFMKLDMVNA